MQSKKVLLSRSAKIIKNIADNLHNSSVEEIEKYLIGLPYNYVIKDDLIKKSKNKNPAQLAIEYGLTIDQVYYITKRKIR
jgi:flagellin-specific chaperone FliS